jgi:hypothetical protein
MDDHGWNGTSLLAAPIAVVEAGAVVDTHWTILGGLKDLSFSANLVWPRAAKEMKVVVRLADLSMFTFAATPNLSDWLCRNELEVTFTHTVTAPGEPAITSNISYEQAQQHGAGEFCLRCLITPKDHLGAGLWVAASPYSKATLQQRLGANFNSHLTPHITLTVNALTPYPNASRAGRSAYALFSRQEQLGDGFGFGVLPWIDVTAEGEEDATCPDPDALKEALLVFMRASTTAATATTAGTMGARMAAVVAGQGVPPKNPAHVFPMFEVSTGGAEHRQGTSRFFYQSLISLVSRILLKTGLGPVKSLC